MRDMGSRSSFVTYYYPLGPSEEREAYEREIKRSDEENAKLKAALRTVWDFVPEEGSPAEDAKALDSIDRFLAPMFAKAEE